MIRFMEEYVVWTITILLDGRHRQSLLHDLFTSFFYTAAFILADIAFTLGSTKAERYTISLSHV